MTSFNLITAVKALFPKEELAAGVTGPGDKDRCSFVGRHSQPVIGSAGGWYREQTGDKWLGQGGAGNGGENRRPA